MKKRLNIKYPVDIKYIHIAQKLFSLDNTIIDLSLVAKNGYIFSDDTDGFRITNLSDIPEDWWEDVPEPNESEFYNWYQENEDLHDHSYRYEVAKRSRNKTLSEVITIIDDCNFDKNHPVLYLSLIEKIKQLKEK